VFGDERVDDGSVDDCSDCVKVSARPCRRPKADKLLRSAPPASVDCGCKPPITTAQTPSVRENLGSIPIVAQARIDLARADIEIAGIAEHELVEHATVHETGSSAIPRLIEETFGFRLSASPAKSPMAIHLAIQRW